MDKHQGLIDEIASSHQTPTKVRAEDSDIIDDTQVQRLREYGEGHERRDLLYAELLQQYIDLNRSKAKWNTGFKCAFFVITLLILAVLIVAPMVIYWNISQKDSTNAADVAVVVGCTAEILSSVIVLPKIIAQHLFPTNENEHLIGMVKNMQLNDSQIRDTSRQKKAKQQYRPQDKKK